jgi:hypothetical protein
MTTRNLGRSLDYDHARDVLSDLFRESEIEYRGKIVLAVDQEFSKAVVALFASSTQSFREVLLGCGLVRLLDKEADLRLPYANMGSKAYNGRTLDEKVVNPLLHDRQIPASKGPYLATFRRSVRFDSETRAGVRDKKGYDAFLSGLQCFESVQNDEQIRKMLRFVLSCFLSLRDAADIPLARIRRLNLDQFENLFSSLLQTPSGGLLPVLLTVAMFKTVKECYNLDWEVEWQGINVADKASGVGGDITVKRKEEVLCAVEITERPIDRSRVVSTFNTKISPNAIEDYLFVFTNTPPASDARQAATQYFNQGHDVNFVDLKPWLLNNLAMVGGKCRTIFTRTFLDLLSGRDVPAALKVKWNDLVKELFG